MRWLWLSGVVAVLDQLSKYQITKYFSVAKGEFPKPPIELGSWFNFILAHNTGAAFSFLGDAGGWQRWFFAALASIVSVVLIIWLAKLPKKALWLSCTLALILGGAVGNLIDRVRFGYVTDFIDFHIGNWHFATFNVADIAISIGFVMLLIDAFFLPDYESETE